MSSKLNDPGHSEVDRNAASDPGYETSDANTEAVMGFLAVLFVVLALTLFVTWRLFRHDDVADQQPAPASIFTNVRQIPSGPELEVNAREDYLKIYARQQQELETYSWADRSTGMVQVPIERAMDMLLQKGLPVLSSRNPDGATQEKSLTMGPQGTVGAPGTVHNQGPGGNE
jgi:hypothetical protein